MKVLCEWSHTTIGSSFDTLSAVNKVINVDNQYEYYSAP